MNFYIEYIIMEQSRKEKLDDIKHEITILKDDIIILNFYNEVTSLKRFLIL